MKTLFILRHGKAAHGSGGDKQRPLTPHGEEQCQKIADFLSSANPKPDQILSSTASRAEQTTNIVNQSLGIPAVWSEALYLAGVPALLDQINRQQCDSLLVVGHNPGLEELIFHLCDEVHRGYVGLGTANLVQIDLHSAGEVFSSCGKMVSYIQP